MSDPTQTTPTIPTPPTGVRSPNQRPYRRAIAAVLGIIVVLLLLLAATASGGDTATGSPSDSSATSPSTTGEDGFEKDADTDRSDGTDDGEDDGDDGEDVLDSDDDSTGYADSGENVAEPAASEGGDPEPVELDPVETVDEQCAKVLASGASLLVTPDPAELEAGVMSDSLTIRNCGDTDVDWTAKTVPDVDLDTAASTLGADTTTQLGFTIDSDAYEPGAIEFKIKVSEPGHNTYVDVHAFRKTFGTDVQAGNGQLSAGEGAGGCANSCITKAWLTPNASSADVSFEVETNTPAKIRVWVGTQPQNGAGAPMAASPEGATQWNTVLQPLQADTTYHLLLRATDGNGKTDERTHTFKTSKPVTTVDGYAGVDPKCHAQCISQAKLAPGTDFSVQHLAVQSTTPARFQVWLSTDAPTDGNGTPTFTDPDLVEVSGLTYHQSWDVDLEPLAGSTTYHIIVRAEDVDGTVAHRVGQFHTAPEPTSDVLITFQQLTVTHDGDSSWKNRGELSFAWAVGDTTVGTRSEHKMSDGDGFSFNRSKSSYLATGLHDGDFLPNIRVSGSERDADGLVEFCSMGTGAAQNWGHNDDCDAKWNVASAGLVTVGSIDSMTRCSEFGIADPTGRDGCLLLETADHGEDYARFQVLVSFHVAD